MLLPLLLNNLLTGAGQVVPVGLATETDSAFAVVAVKGQVVGLSLESDSAFTITWFKSLLAGLALETDSAFTVTALLGYLVGLAVEIDTASSVLLVKDVYTVHVYNITGTGFQYEVYRITGGGELLNVTATVPINWIAIEA